MLYYDQCGKADPSGWRTVAEGEWKRVLKLRYRRGGHRARVSDAMLTPISRKLLTEIRDEVQLADPSFVEGGGGSSWLAFWTRK